MFPTSTQSLDTIMTLDGQIHCQAQDMLAPAPPHDLTLPYLPPYLPCRVPPSAQGPLSNGALAPNSPSDIPNEIEIYIPPAEERDMALCQASRMAQRGTCRICGLEMSEASRRRHESACGKDKDSIAENNKCPTCGNGFSRPDALLRHCKERKERGKCPSRRRSSMQTPYIPSPIPSTSVVPIYSSPTIASGESDRNHHHHEHQDEPLPFFPSTRSMVRSDQFSPYDQATQNIYYNDQPVSQTSVVQFPLGETHTTLSDGPQTSFAPDLGQVDPSYDWAYTPDFPDPTTSVVQLGQHAQYSQDLSYCPPTYQWSSDMPTSSIYHEGEHELFFSASPHSQNTSDSYAPTASTAQSSRTDPLYNSNTPPDDFTTLHNVPSLQYSDTQHPNHSCRTPYMLSHQNTSGRQVALVPNTQFSIKSSSVADTVPHDDPDHLTTPQLGRYMGQFNANTIAAEVPTSTMPEVGFPDRLEEVLENSSPQANYQRSTQFFTQPASIPYALGVTPCMG